MVDPGKIIAEIISAFLSGLALGAVISAMYSAMETMFLSIAIGGLIGLILFFFNLALFMDDVTSLKAALAKGSVISLILWGSGFFGSIVGSSIVMH